MTTPPIIPDPRNLSFQDWVGQLIVNVDPEPLAIPPPEEDWKDYAAYLGTTSALNPYPVPNPYDVPDWRTWALSLLYSVN
mgnify:CR=1